MTAIPDTISEYSQYAAQEFLQTVVFIDDRIYRPGDESVAQAKKVAPPKARKMATKTAEQKASEPVVSQDAAEEHEYSPHDVLISFAKKQIICSLYQPPKKAKVSRSSDIYKLCLSADIVIVDWDLYGDRGAKALELIEGLIQQAVRDVPEQLRLILVYTQEQNLFDIANQLYEKITDSVGDEIVPLKEESGLAFHSQNIRVSVLGKTGRTRPEEWKEHEVSEKELADIAVNEFTKLANGLLHAATLLGLAEIKKNSRKILSKFNAKLDPAFLTHMAMSLPEEDASTHIVPLLVSEIESVLEDALPHPLMPERLIQDWCHNLWKPGDHLKDIFGKKVANLQAVAETICLKGFQSAKEKHKDIPKLGNNDKTRKAAKILLSADDDKSNHLFAHLMASRTFYGDKPKELKLGAIVHEMKDDKYFLCIQPICDSVRINEERVFVFVQMIKTDTVTTNQASHIVVNSEGEPLELYYQAKSFKCFTATFTPDPDSKQVISTNSSKGEPVFTDISKRKYTWIDQLKPAHAQRAVENFASDLSRVGLTESEWLRQIERK